jgi:hypothetical protein
VVTILAVTLNDYQSLYPLSLIAVRVRSNPITAWLPFAAAAANLLPIFGSGVIGLLSGQQRSLEYIIMAGGHTHWKTANHQALPGFGQFAAEHRYIIFGSADQDPPYSLFSEKWEANSAISFILRSTVFKGTRFAC